MSEDEKKVEKKEEKKVEDPKSEEMTSEWVGKDFCTSDQDAIWIITALDYVPDRIEPSYEPSFRLTYHFSSEAWIIYDKYIRREPIMVDAHKMFKAHKDMKSNFRIFQNW